MAEITQRSLKKSRTVLHEVLPVDTPFLFGIFVGDICNFKCKYCIQSAEDGVPEKRTLVKQFLEWEKFLKIADSAKKFPHKIKTVLFSSIGEPLLNPRLPDMIRYLNEIDLADAYEIVTNASLLTPELGKQLVDAGLTRLCISLQGLTSVRYKEVCGVEIDYPVFYENIKEFYEYSRGKCKLHIKIVDMALDEGEDVTFMKMYSPLCDTIYIDKVAPVFKGVDYDGIVQDTESYTENEYEKNAAVCCSPVFYTLYTLADGRIVPCCDHPQPLSYGNIDHISLVDAWNSQRRRDFLIQHLKHHRCDNAICKHCTIPLVREFEEDILDGYEDQILEKLSE